MFKKRIGPDPHIEGGKTTAAAGCPDIWELENGDIAVIGIRKTSVLSANLPNSAGCGPDEEIVILPRDLIRKAAKDISNL